MVVICGFRVVNCNLVVGLFTCIFGLDMVWYGLIASLCWLTENLIWQRWWGFLGGLACFEQFQVPLTTSESHGSLISRSLDRFPIRVGYLVWRTRICVHTDEVMTDSFEDLQAESESQSLRLRGLSWVSFLFSSTATTMISDDGSSGLCGYPTLEGQYFRA